MTTLIQAQATGAWRWGAHMSDKIDHALVESAISVAGVPDSDVLAQVADLGPAAVAETTLTEVVGRAALFTGPAERVAVQYELVFDEGTLDYAVVLDGDDIELQQGTRTAAATIRQDLVELLREVFGPVGKYDATREVMLRRSESFPGSDANEPVNRQRAAAIVALRQLLGASAQRPPDLTDLAVRFESDKWGGHWYTPHYQRYFERMRDLPVKILEIGVGGYELPESGGASLRMWKHYFRRGLIYGLDIFEKAGIEEPRIQVLRGDQGDARYLHEMAHELGPFEIVIDDGSHCNEDVVTSFNALFPHVRPGGLYVVEDVQTSYWPGWGGAADPTAATTTSIALIKSLVDGLNHQEQIRPASQSPSTTERLVTGVHAHHNIVFIDKGLNTEQGPPPWFPLDVDATCDPADTAR